MNAVSYLSSFGLEVKLDESGGVTLTGLHSLPAEQRKAALNMARESRESIIAELRRGEACEADQRTLGYARSLLVPCPGFGRKLHCWHCSRCGYAPRCNAWRRHFHQVKEFEGRGKPLSLLLLEDEEALKKCDARVLQ